MTRHHIAAGTDDTTRPLTEAEYRTLLALNLIAPCASCTELLVQLGHAETDDEVVHHPCSDEDEAEVAAVLNGKKH